MINKVRFLIVPAVVMAVIMGGGQDAYALLDNVHDRSVNAESTLRFLVNTELVSGSPTYSLVGNVPAGAAIDAGTGLFSWLTTEDQADKTYTFTIRASEGGTDTDRSITVTVNGPIADHDYYRHVSGRTSLSVFANNEQVRWRLTDQNGAIQNLPGSVSTSHNTWGYPSFVTTPGVTRILEIRENSKPWGADTSIYLQFTGTDRNPTILPNPYPILTVDRHLTVNEGETIIINASATDDKLPINSLSFSDQNRPDGSSLDKIGPNYAAFSWTPTEEQGGSTDGGTRDYRFNIRVTDSTREQSRGITITVNEVNQDPVTTFKFEDRDVVVGHLHEFTATFTDDDLPPQTLTYDLVGETFGATIHNETGHFSWTPPHTSVEAITIRVNQSLGDDLIDSYEVPVSFNVFPTVPTNLAPNITSIPPKSTDELDPLEFAVEARDDGLPFFSEIEYSLSSSAPPGAVINSTTGYFSWTPTEEQGGFNYTFDIIASDGDLSTPQEITIPVRDTNQAPVPRFELERDAILNDPHRFTAIMDDADRPLQFVTYELVGQTYGAQIDSNTGFFEWTPTDDHEGPRTITIRVQQVEVDMTRQLLESEQYTDDIVINFDVIHAPLIEIEDRQVNVYSTLRFPFSAPGGNVVPTYGLDNPPDGAQIDPATGLFTWAPLGDQIGRHTIIATVSHEGELSDTEEFVVEVLNDPLANVTQVLASQDRVRAEVHIGDRPIDLRVTDLGGATQGFETGAAEKINTVDTISIPGSETTAGREYILEVWPDADLNPGAGKNRDENVYVRFPGRQNGHVGVTPGFEYISNPLEYVFRIPPIVTVDHPPAVAEGSQVMFTVSAIDEIPGTVLRFTATDRPAGSTLNDTGQNYAIFTWTPGEEDGPQTHNFDIRVYDGTATAVAPISIQVSEVNQDPTPAFDVTDRIAVANEPHRFTATFEDADLPRQRFEYGLASSAFEVTIDRMTGDFEWTPTERHLGDQTIVIIVFQYVDTEIFGRTETRLVGQSQIPVTFDVRSAPPPNDPPVIDELSPMIIDENDTLTFNVTATDDGRPFDSQIMYSLDGTAPDGAAINSTTGNFTWTPTEEQGGTILDGARRVYKFNVTASDSQDYDVELIAITVNEVNQDPIPVFETDREAVVDQTHTFVASVTDSDLPVQYLEYSIQGDSFGATIHPDTGVFEWTPTADHEGPRDITIRILQDGQYNHDIPVAFVVHPTPPEIPLVIVNADDRTVRQYSTVRFQVDATGAEGNLRFGLKDGPPSDATIDQASGLFHWFADENSDKTFTITATDGTKTAEESITITVNEPIIDMPDTIRTSSGDTSQIFFQVNSERIDYRLTDTTPSLVSGTDRYGASPDSYPSATTFTVASGETRILEVRPAGGSWRNDRNMYVQFDGHSTSYEYIENSAAFRLANKAPLLTVEPYSPVVEGSTITIRASATDADFVPDEITFAAPDRPAGSAFDTTADSATLTWTPGEEHGPGTHQFQIEATNGGKTSRETVSIVVLEQNQDPIITFDTNRVSPPPETGELYTFQVTFDDADLPPQRFEYEIINNTLGADIGRHTGVFEWTPTTGHLGNRDMTIRATQFLGTAEQGDYDVLVQFQVIEPQPDNLPPVLEAIPNYTAFEGQRIEFTVNAGDDGQPVNIPLTYSLSDDAPGNAVIGRTGGVFSWIPGEEHGEQTHTFNVTVSDSELTDTQQIWIQVEETNQNPVPTFETDRIAISKQSNVFTATVDDPDDPPQEIRYAFDGSSLGAQINPVTGVFRWTPTASQVGSQTIFIKVTQNGVHEHVIRVNFDVPPATLDLLNRTVQAYSTLRFVPFTVGGTNSPVYNLVNAPDGATINPATGLFTWVPDGSQIGDNTFNITVTDRAQTDSKQIVVTVTNYVANVTEVRASAGSAIPIFGIGNDPLDLRITDLDGRRLGDTAGSGQNINQLWSLTIPNTETAAGQDYLLEVRKKGTSWGTDDGVFVQFPGRQNGFVGVDDGFEVISNPNPYRVINRQPVLTVEQQYYEVDEGQTVIVGATATDDREPDNTLTFTAPDRPAGSTLETGTSDAVITWHTGETHGPETYDFDITVSDGRLSDSERITIRVNEVNRDPIPEFNTDRTIAANSRHNFTAVFEDADIPEQALRYSITGPDRGAIIDEETGHFSWRPNDGHVMSEAQIITIMVDQYIGRVDDTPEYSAQVPVRFTVVPEPPENMAPTLAAIPPLSYNEGEPVIFTAIGGDDGLPIGSTTFSLAGIVPDGATIHPSLGTFVWMPAEDQHGTHLFDVVISDSALNASTPVSINIVETNQDPVFAAGTAQTATVNTPFMLELGTTDPDIPEQKVTHRIISQNPQANPAVINPDTGVITWQPATVEMRTITVRASDDYTPNGASDITLVVNVLPPNEPPMAADYETRTGEDTPITFRPVISDTDNTEAISGVQDGAKGATSHTATTITYAPYQDRNGPDTFEYTVTDSRGAATTARVNMTIIPVNDPPVLDPIGERGATVGSELVIIPAASDPDRDALTYSLIRGTLPDEAAFDNATGTLRWTPGPDDASDEHEIVITVSDPEGSADSETITVSVTDESQNNAVPDTIYSVSMGAGGRHTLDVLANDNVITGSTITSVTNPVIMSGGVEHADEANAGTAEIIAGTMIRYTEGSLYGTAGSIVTFDYMISNTASSDTATVTLIPERPALDAADDFAITIQNRSVNINVLRNDMAVEAELRISQAPVRGEVDIEDNGTITYEPDKGYAGQDPFEYELVRNGQSEAATVTVTVAIPATFEVPANDEGAEFIAIPELEPYTPAITVTNPDEIEYRFDIDPGDPPAAGANITQSGHFSWTPDETTGGGTYTVTITLDPEVGDIVTRQMTLSVSETNQIPIIADPGPQTVRAGRTLELNLTVTDGDEFAGDPEHSPAFGFVLDDGTPGLTDDTGATINATSGQITWVTTADDIETHILTVEYNDDFASVVDGAASGTHRINITVTVKDAPGLAISDIPDKSVNALSTLRITDITVQNATGDVRYSIDPLEGARIHPVTGHLVYVPNASRAGDTPTLTVHATDDSGSASATIDVTVGQPIAAIDSVGTTTLGSQQRIEYTAGSQDTLAIYRYYSGGTSTTHFGGTFSAAAGASSGGITTNSFQSTHPIDGALYYLEIRVSTGQYDRNENIFVKFTPGESEYEIMPNPASRPDPHAPDLDRSTIAGMPEIITPTLVGIDGRPPVITAATGTASESTVTHTPTTVTYTAGATATGTDTVIYTVTDDTGRTGTGMITININTDTTTPAGISLQPLVPPGASEGVEMTYQIPVSNPDNLEIMWNITSDDLGAIITDDGVFTWMPGEDDGGQTRSFDFTAAASSNTVNGIMEVAVTEINEYPVFDMLTEYNATVGVEREITLVARDADRPPQTLTYSLDTPNPAASIDGDMLTWNATQEGETTLTIRVQDGFAPPGEDTLDITIDSEVAGPPTAPTITETVTQGSGPHTYTPQLPAGATITDVQTFRISHPEFGSITNPPKSLEGATGRVSHTASTVTYTQGTIPGEIEIIYAILGADGQAGTGTIMITIEAENVAPQLNPSRTSYTVSAGQRLEISLGYSDPETPLTDATFALSGDDLPGHTFENDRLIWTPGSGDTGTKTATVTVTDQGGLTDAVTLTIMVDPNTAPMLDDIGNQTASVGRALTFTATATDVEDDAAGATLTYALTHGTLPAGSTFGEHTFGTATGAFAWTPTAADAGTTINVNITVTDSAGDTDSEEFTITVPRGLVANDDRLVATGLGPQTFDVLENDEYEGNVFISRFRTLTHGVSAPQDRTLFGTMALSSDGRGMTYTPGSNPGIYGSSFIPYPTYEYTLQDVNGIEDTATVTIVIVTPVVEVSVAPSENSAVFTITRHLIPSNTNPNLMIEGRILDDSDSTVYTFDSLPTYNQFDSSDIQQVTVALPADTLMPDTTYTYQFASSEDTEFDGDTAVTGTFATSAPPTTPIVFGAIQNQSVVPGGTVDYEIPLTSPDRTAITQWSIQRVDSQGFPLDTDAQIDTNGRFTWVTTAADNSRIPYTFVITATDGTLSNTVTLTVTVNNVNNPPVITGLPTEDPIVIPAGQEYTFTVNAENPDAVSMIDYRLPASGNPPAGAEINTTTGVFTWTPTEEQGGNHTIIVRVLDRGGDTDHRIDRTLNFRVAVFMAVDDEATTAPNRAVLINVLLNDLDAAGATTALVEDGKNGAATRNANNTFIYRPDDGFVGTDWFTYNITNGDDTDTANVTVRVAAVTDDEIRTQEDTPVIIPVRDNDNVDDVDIISVTNGTNGNATRNDDNTITYAPNLNYYGPDSFTYTIEYLDVSHTATVNVDVRQVIDPVSLELPQPQDNIMIDQGMMYSFTMTVVNPDNITYALSFVYEPETDPPATFDAETGLFSWTPPLGHSGINAYFSLNPEIGETIFETLIIYVNPTESPVISAPIQDIDDARHGVEIRFDVQARDPDMGPRELTYELTGTVPDGAEINSTNGTFTWTPTREQAGNAYPITVRVSDGAAHVDDTFDVVVAAANQPLTVTPASRTDSVSLGGTWQYGRPGITDDAHPDYADITYHVTGDIPAGLTLLRSHTADFLDPATVSYDASVAVPEGLTLVDEADNFISWRPTSPDDFGRTYRFNLVFGDGEFNTTISFTITVNDIAHPDTTDTVTGYANRSSVIFPLENDGEPTFFIKRGITGARVAIGSIFGSAQGGTTMLAGDKTAILYTPPEGFTGRDVIGYSFVQEHPIPAFNQDPEIPLPSRAYIFVDVSDSTDASPTINEIQNITVSKSDTAMFAASATDPEETGILYMLLEGAPSDSAIDNRTGVFEWATDEGDVGTHAVTVVAADGANLTVTESVTITVQDAETDPELTLQDAELVLPDPVTAEIGRTLEFNIVATDVDIEGRDDRGIPIRQSTTLAWSALPPGATITKIPTDIHLVYDIYEFKWTPETFDPHTINLALTDTTGRTGTLAVNLTVRDTTPPEIKLVGADPLTVEQDSEYVDPGANVTDNDPAYAGTATSDATGVNTGTLGQYVVRYTAPQDASGNAPAGVNRTVNVVEPSDLELPDINNASLSVHSTLREKITGQNPTGEVRYSIDPLEGARIHPVTGDLVYVPVPDHVGVRNLTVHATDDIKTISTVINVTVGEPIARNINITGSGNEYTLSADATGGNIVGVFRTLAGSTHTDHGSGGPASSISASSQAGWGIADPQPDTIYYVEIRPEGDGALPDSDGNIYARVTPGTGFDIIPNPNTRPEPHAPDVNASAYRGIAADIPPVLFDMDGGILAITQVTDGTNGRAFSTTTTVTYTANSAASGTDTLTYTVADDIGQTGTGMINIDINTTAPVPITLVDLASPRTSEGEKLEYTIPVYNPDGHVIMWRINSDDLGAVITKDGVFTWTPGEEHGGENYEFIFTASAPSNTITTVLMVSVEESNQNPVFDMPTEYNSTVGEKLVIMLEANDADRPNQTLTYSLVASNPAASIDGDTLTWIPGAEHVPEQTLALRVRDDSRLQGEDRITITINVEQLLLTVTPTPTQNGVMLAVTPSVIVEIIGRVTHPNGTVVREFDPVTPDAAGVSIPFVISDGLEPGTGYRYQFARSSDTGYVGDDVVSGDFTTTASAPTQIGLGTLEAQQASEMTELRYPIPTVNPSGQTITWVITSEDDRGAMITNAGVLTWTPGEEDGGETREFDFTATAPTNEVSGTLSVVVAETNQDPAFEAHETDLTEFTNNTLTYDLNATDDDEPPQTITYSITEQNPPENPALINSTTGLITWTPAAAQNRTITVEASDNYTPNGTATTTLTVMVFDKIPLATVTVSVAPLPPSATFRVTAYENIIGRILDGSTTVYNFTEITPQPAGPTHTPTFIVVPRLESNTTYTYEFTRSNDPGYAGDDIIRGTFETPPVPIVVRPTQPQSVSEGGEVNHPIPVLNPDAHVITWTITPDNLGAQITTDGRFVWMPGEEHGGNTYEFEFTAQAATNTVNGTLSVTVTETNQNPVLRTINDDRIEAGMMLTFNVTADDADLPEQTLTYSATDLPVNATITSHGVFSWTPTVLQIAKHTFAITVSDSQGGTDSQNVTITVLPRSTSPVPDDGSIVIAPVTDTAVGRLLGAYMQRSLVVFAGIFEDITRAIPAGPAGPVGPANGGFLLAGIIINTTGADGTGIASRITGPDDTTVFISELGNVPPVLSAIGDYTINAHDTLTFVVSATDFGNDTISYALSGAPGNATISGHGGFSWTPMQTDVGNHTFTITAHDGQGGADTEDITVRVLPAGTPNLPPTAPDVTATVAPDGRVVIVPAIYDPDGDPVRITGATGDAVGVIIPSDDHIEYIAGPDAAAETITYKVVDSRGGTATGTITITIQ